ncbi:MAG TPA: response regulator [Phycisphaerae bacterium]|nr:response regulator [Phycisphaerae bacterium]
MKVLIIDDSRAMRHILRKILTAMGHEVVEAGNGQEGLDKVDAAGPFGMALVDWNMPLVNGFEFVCRVRADARHSGMKLMMVTTEVEMAQVSRALEAGANEYVMKPFTDDVIREKIELLQAA